MKEADSTLLEALAGVVGAGHVLRDPALYAARLIEPRGLYQGRALALVRPGSTAEVAAVAALCEAARQPMIPQGGNTGLVGGQTPDDSGREVIVSTERLKAVREIDADADVMIVEAGATLAEAQSAAETANRLFPLALAAEGTCTIGGNVSTNAGGVAAVSYGVMRDLVTGLEVVLPDGRIVHALSKLRKDNTGYDLKNLFIGAEGTLGIVTAASLRLFPLPRSRATAFVGLASPEAALALFRLARTRFGGGLVSYELMTRFAIEIVERHCALRAPLAAPHRWYVLIEVASPLDGGLDDALTALIGEAAEGGAVEDAVFAASLAQRDAFWRLRESIPDAQTREGGSIKHDISIPIGAAPDFIAAGTEAVEAFLPGARVCAFGHLGDGNLHFNVTQPVGADKAAYLARWSEMNAVVHAVVKRFGGSYSAEHGIGRLKRGLLASEKDPTALALMRQIKATIDPHGVMNPGKVL